MTLRPCCAWFENLLSDPGEKGFSIIPVAGKTERYFVLQARSVDPKAVDELTKRLGPDPRPVSIALSMDLKLRHCAGCGRPLVDVIHEQVEAFDLAAAELKHLGAGYGDAF